jgi:hypothetical protein
VLFLQLFYRLEKFQNKKLKRGDAKLNISSSKVTITCLSQTQGTYDLPIQMNFPFSVHQNILGRILCVSTNIKRKP